jgi:hypothetical protein
VLDQRGYAGVAVVIAAVVVTAVVPATVTAVADAAIGFFVVL